MLHTVNSYRTTFRSKKISYTHISIFNINNKLRVVSYFSIKVTKVARTREPRTTKGVTPQSLFG